MVLSLVAETTVEIAESCESLSESTLVPGFKPGIFSDILNPLSKLVILPRFCAYFGALYIGFLWQIHNMLYWDPSHYLGFG